MQVMKERDDSQPLTGIIQLDDAYWEGERRGGKRGRGAANKSPFVAAVATNDEGHPIAMRLSSVTGFLSDEINRWAHKHLVADRELAGLIEDAVDGLPLEFRTVFVLRAIQQLSAEEDRRKHRHSPSHRQDTLSQGSKAPPEAAETPLGCCGSDRIRVCGEALR